MDAKKLKSGYKIESKLIPVAKFTGKSLSDQIDFILSYYDKLLGHETKARSLNYAADHFGDEGRAKEYSKIIAEKWNIPEEKIIHEIYFVIFFVKLLMINDRYGVDKINSKEKSELSKKHNLINEIEAGSIDTLEITLKATGKGVSSDVQLKSDAVVRKIFECLKSLPEAEINPRSKGRPKGIKPETYIQSECAKEIRETYSSQFVSQNELYEFIGYIFVAAGIFMDENEFYNSQLENPTYGDYLIQKIKSIL